MWGRASRFETIHRLTVKLLKPIGLSDAELVALEAFLLSLPLTEGELAELFGQYRCGWAGYG